MPVVTIANIAVMLVLMALLPYSFPESYPVRPIVAIGLLILAAVVGVIIGVRRRQRGWNTDSTRKLT